MKVCYFLLLLLNFFVASAGNVLPPSGATISGTTTVCQNATAPVITFTGNGGTAPYTFTYNINSGTNLITTISSGNSATVTAPTNISGIYTYNLISVSDASMPNNQVPATGTAVVTVTNPHSVDFTFTNNNTCSGTTIQFTSTVTGPGTNTYSWDFGDGTPFSTAQNPSHNFIALGCVTQSFNITLTVIKNGCTAVKTSTITVKEKPEIVVEDQNAGATNQFSNCANTTNFGTYSITVGNSSPSSSCISSFSINWGDSTSANSVIFPITHVYLTRGVFNMEVIATGSNGCSNSKIYQVKNISNPSGGILNPGGTADMCLPAPIIAYSIGNWALNSLGTTYDVDYGDGLPHLILQQDSMVLTSFYNTTNPASSLNYPVPYAYSTVSCPNDFIITLVVTNACKSTTGTVVGGNTRKSPVANFTSPASSCVNANVLFTNSTVLGYDNGCARDTKFTWDFGDPASGSANTITTAFLTTAPNANHTFSSIGIYTITLTARNGCGTTTKTQQICIEPPLAPTFTVNVIEGCTPLNITTNNTTITTNSCSPPTYTWSVTHVGGNCGTTVTSIPNQTTTNATYNFIEAGTYTIKLTITNSCGSFNNSQTVIVKKPPVISVINGVSANYCGPTTINPVATVASCTTSVGTTTYAWSFPSGNPSSATTLLPGSISYSASGNYTISLIATNECGSSSIFTKTFTINDVPSLTTTPLVQNICSGTATTPIVLTANIASTTFSWTGTATAGISGFLTSGTTNTIPAQTINNSSLNSGTVTYVITPSINGCSGLPINYIITVNPGPSITTQPASSTTCLGGTPTVLNVTLNNTSGNPTYQWFSNITNNTTTGTAIVGATSSTYAANAVNIGGTYYYCIITLTSGGCSNISSNTALVTVVNSATIATQPLVTQNLCVGSTITTPLTVAYSGGSGTPTYQWYNNTSNSNINGTPIPGATSVNYTPTVFTVANTYYYYVTITLGGSSCGNLTSAVAEIIVNIDPTIATQPLSSQTVCQNASPTTLNVVLSSTSNIFSYQWYTNSLNNTTSGTIIIGATNNSYSPPTILAGTKYYYCVITQNGTTGCGVTSSTGAVVINIAPSFNTQPLSSSICLGQSIPQLSVTYANGNGTALYQWFSNNINSNINGTAIATANSSTYQPLNTVVGTNFYYCIVTFPSLAGGCGIITSNVAEVIVNAKATISAQTLTICSGATFTIIPNNSAGDTVPVGTTYSWSNPIINPSVAITGASGQAVAQNSISQTLINITPAVATVTYTVTPITGTCLGIAFSITITVNPATNPNGVKSNITCFGINNGAISTNITGGIPFTSGPLYTILWTGPNSYTSSSSNINNLFPGNYTLSITDAGGCSVINNYTIIEPNDISITTNVKSDITCFGANDGNIAITASGGTGNYVYTWTKNGLLYAATEDISNLSPATYVLSVTDANNCGPKTLSLTITEPPLLVISLVSQTNINCFGASTGAIIINTVGGTKALDYNYSWVGPNGFTSNNKNLTNILAGTYALTVTDDLGCNKNLSVTITQSSEIIINAITTPIVCYGDNNATIIVTLSGGTAPYSIQWDNLAVGLFQNNLSPGNYTITVSDNLGCQKIATINIPSPPIFAVNPIVTNISCKGANDGSIVLNFVGGIAPVNLIWSDGSTAGITRNNLGPGIYSVVISDSKPCTISKTFTILEPQQLVLSGNITNALNCSDANSGVINLLVSGGTPPFIYLWNNGVNAEDLSNIPAGNYSVTVTDSRGCVKSSQYNISRPNPIMLTVDTTTAPDCMNYKVNQNFTAKVTGGVPPYQFNWSSGIVSGTNNQLMTTTQNSLVTLTTSDNIGCTSIYSLNVVTPILGNPTFAASSIGLISYGIFSILDPIQFQSTIPGDYQSVYWDFGDGTYSSEINPIHTYVNQNNYTVIQTVTYPFGCVYKKTLNLTVEKGYVLVVPNAFTPNTDNVNDTLRPVSKGLKNIRLDVYDTWGAMIYSESGDNLVGWNGKINDVLSENGNYYCKVSAETFYGQTVNENHPFVLIK